ncbi:MAG TPA: choline/ethanolamine kinase family protein [Anaerolineae bacterium]|nr:choline/ethanolamine kinase family protein [Anaerolineae bacterium]
MRELPQELAAVIRQIPNRSTAAVTQVERLEGLTNQNYLVTLDGERLVVRLSRENAAALGINRELEWEALSAAAAAGIAPEVVHIILPEGHLVTRYIHGHHWTLAEWRDPVNLRRLVEKVKQLHSLPPVRATFSPFQRVETSIERARTLGVLFPPDFDRFIQAMQAIRQDQQADPYPWLRFCHNDLFCVNVMDDGQVRLLDWEFAGMGDCYFDLATLAYAFDSANTLSLELQESMLTWYFGETTPHIWRRFRGMLFMLLFFTAMWGLVQEGMLQAGVIRAVAGFDFMEYADATFAAMRTALSTE